MKKSFIALIVSVLSLSAFAQDPLPYQFKEIKKLACTPVKNQEKTGTCWCFSTTSFIESELLRMGKGEQNLSEMYLVRNVYQLKCENYVRRQGDARLTEGGLAHDMLNAVKNYGLVPEEIYPGRADPSKPYSHSKLEKDLITLCDTLVAHAKKGTLAEGWQQQIKAVLDAEFGPLPGKFSVKGKPFTARQYADFLGVKPDEYVNVTSFTHHPFYDDFVLEVPDNFAHGSFYNLPLDELMRCLNNALQQGYTVEWDADVSNQGFGAKYGVALVPERDWKDKNEVQRANTFKYVESEKFVTQDYRQQLFDRQITQDDHLMHIVGMLDEPNNGAFYVVKNSWGEISDMKGFVYCSESYMRQNTISFTVHKNALPPDVARRLNSVSSAASTGAPSRRQVAGDATAPQPAPDKAAPAKTTAPNEKKKSRKE